MKKLLIFAACGVMLASCLNQSNSVSSDAVDEMLAAPGMAVTPFQPAWLNEDGKGIYPLSKEARAKVCAILLAGKNRPVPELAYQLDDENDEVEIPYDLPISKEDLKELLNRMGNEMKRSPFLKMKSKGRNELHVKLLNLYMMQFIRAYNIGR